MGGLAKLEAGSVDLIFADPPFNIGYEYDTYDDSKDSDSYLNWSKEWISGCARALKPDGTMWLAIGDEYAAELKVLAQSVGFSCRSWIIWYYTFGVNCVRNFSRSHTHLFYFVRDPKNFTFNDDDPQVRVPSARQLVYNDKRANPRGRLPDNTWILRPQDVEGSFSATEDTWYFPRVCGTFKERAGWHGCQMPEQLLGRIINACSNPGDVVADPFGGSGTTFSAACKLGRSWVGFELSKEYCTQIRARMKRACQGDALEGVEDPLTSVPRTNGVRGRSPARAKAKSPSTRRADRSTKHSALTDEVSERIRDAYLKSCRGASTDRVIADPEIGGRFISACTELDVPGSAADWNHQLLGLRKSGKLKNLPKPERPPISRKEIDAYIFASEIAWRIVADQHDLALDEILCNPERARQFDEIAMRCAPGWSGFHYRWGALRMRKQARAMRRDATQLSAETTARRFSRASTVEQIDRLPAEPGLYILRANKTPIYLGSTLCLRDRVACQVRHLPRVFPEFGLEDAGPASIKIQHIPLGVALERRGMQSRLLAKYQPCGNADLDKQAYSTT